MYLESDKTFEKVKSKDLVSNGFIKHALEIVNL